MDGCPDEISRMHIVTTASPILDRLLSFRFHFLHPNNMPSSRPELRNILSASRRIPRAPFRPLSTSAPLLRPTDEESHFTRAPKTTPYVLVLN